MCILGLKGLTASRLWRFLGTREWYRCTDVREQEYLSISRFVNGVQFVNWR